MEIGKRTQPVSQQIQEEIKEEALEESSQEKEALTFGARSDIENFHNEMIKKDEETKTDNTANFVSDEDPGDAYNLRGKLWRIICNIETEKQRCIDAFEEKRQAALKEYNKLSKSKKKKTTEPNTPAINNPTDLYKYYSTQQTDDVDYHIIKDLKRTVIGNDSFKIDHKTGKNPLYNLLNAYCHYDKEINYC